MSKTCKLEFGTDHIALNLPDRAEYLSLPDDPPMQNTAEKIKDSLASPVAGPGLSDLIKKRLSDQNLNAKDATAAVVVSDNTRPVPYNGEAGILAPIIDVLKSESVGRIQVIVANGTHRSLTEAEMRKMFPESIFGDPVIEIINHVCTDPEMLRMIGTTERGTEVSINRHYLDADIKILTGLVEPHFMAGASGGPKSICPGLVGEKVTYIFHGAEIMSHPDSRSLKLAGNPCQEEARAVAKMAGVDFIVNVTLDGAKKITGVFAGELVDTHAAAVEHLIKTGSIPIKQEYDVVITHAGFVGINHYQAAKSAVEGVKAVKTGGLLIMAANNTEVDPVGSENYRSVLPLLKTLGVQGFDRQIKDKDWKFIPEQWEVQMWGRAVDKLGSLDRLVYCSPQLTGEAFESLGVPGLDGGKDISAEGNPADFVTHAMQQALDNYLKENPEATIAVMIDGPYGTPVLM